ncbi:MAG: hypothetical protein SFY92_00735 [Verrucomicrobiae bacterium]|nr:hypothetical protein [Verrucomicrobiae bacterium]
MQESEMNKQMALTQQERHLRRLYRLLTFGMSLFGTLSLALIFSTKFPVDSKNLPTAISIIAAMINIFSIIELYRLCRLLIQDQSVPVVETQK